MCRGEERQSRVQNTEWMYLRYECVVVYCIDNWAGMKPSQSKYQLRKRAPRKVIEPDPEDLDQPHSQEEIVSDAEEDILNYQLRRRPIKHYNQKYEVSKKHNNDFDDGDIFDENLQIDKLPKNINELKSLLTKVEVKIFEYEREFFDQEKQNSLQQSFVGRDSVPVCADIRSFNFELLRSKQLEFGKRLYDVVMMDPPWKLSSSNPSRGVAIQYDSLSDEIISKIPITRLQTEGFLCIWTINAKYQLTCQLLKEWGYQLVNEITWIKKTVNGKIAKGHGFYLQHAKESCLVGFKGNMKSGKYKVGISSNVIFSQRRGQSQKPTEVYEILEKLVPNGYYLEIFGRRNNLRDKWVTIGNEI